MAEPSAPLSADAQCDLIEHIRDQMGEVLDDLSGWDRSLWTQEARLKEAIDILTETLPQLDRLAAAVREGEARGRARVLAVFEQIAQADLDQWGERPTREEQTTVTEAIAKAREALAAGEADGH